MNMPCRFEHIHGDEDIFDIADELLEEKAAEAIQDESELRAVLEDEFLAHAIATTMLLLDRADRGELPAISQILGAWIKVQPQLIDLMRDRVADKMGAV